LFDGNNVEENGTWDIEGTVNGNSSLTLTSSTCTKILGSTSIDTYVTISDIGLSISSGKIILGLNLKSVFNASSGKTAVAKCIADIEILSLV